MRTAIVSSALLVAVAAVALAQVPYDVRQSTESNIDFFTSNYGIFGLDVAKGRSGFIAPRGSSKAYLFGSGIWFAAQKQVEGKSQKLVFITYNPNSGASWGEPGEASIPNGDTSIMAAPWLYHSTDYDHNTGEYSGPTVPPSSPNWPLWLTPGATATPLHVGTFVRHVPDRHVGSMYAEPAFVPGVSEQFYSRFHDRNLGRYEIAVAQAQQMGFPLGIQVQQNVYAWKNGPLRDVVVLQYDIINVSGDTLRDCAVAQVADPDIGLATNDHLGFYTQRPELRTSFVWTEMEDTPYGSLAMTLLEGPVTNEHGFIDNSRRQEYRSTGRVATSPNWGIATDPKTPQERYDFMTSGTIDTDTDAGDRRTLLATGKFNMLPGDTAHYAFAFTVLEERPGATDRKGSDDRSIASAESPELEMVISTLTAGYYNQFTGVATLSVAQAGKAAPMSAAPNPATAGATLRWELTHRSNVTLEIRNSIGQMVLSRSLGNLDAGSYQEQLDVTTLASGVYVVVVRSSQGTQTAQLTIAR